MRTPVLCDDIVHVLTPCLPQDRTLREVLKWQRERPSKKVQTRFVHVEASEMLASVLHHELALMTLGTCMGVAARCEIPHPGGLCRGIPAGVPRLSKPGASTR